MRIARHGLVIAAAFKVCRDDVVTLKKKALGQA